MSNTLSQQEVNATAWAACDTFRGVIDPAQYKDYILVMLFLKYISDQWADHYAKYRKQYGNNEERIRRKLERERLCIRTGHFAKQYSKRANARPSQRRPLPSLFSGI